MLGIFTNLQNSLFHIRTWGGASLQRWKDSNWSKAAKVAIDQGFKQASFHEQNNRLGCWQWSQSETSSLATKVMIKTLEWKFKLTSSTRIKKQKTNLDPLYGVLLPQGPGVNTSA